MPIAPMEHSAQVRHMKGARVLIVEDELIIGMHIKNVLISRGYEVSGPITSGEETLKIINEETPDILLLDIMLDGEKDGIQLYQELRQRFDIPAIYLTAHSDAATLARARDTNPYGYVLKPINENELYSTIELALYKHDIEKKLKESEAKFRAIFEQSFQFIGLLQKEGSIVEANRQSLDLAGTSLSEVRGKPLWEAPWFAGLSKEQEKMREAVARAGKGEFVRMETYHRSADGSLRMIDFSLKPVFDDGGNIIFLIPEGRDITAIKEANEKNNLQNQELQAVNEELNETIEKLEATNEEFEAQYQALISAENKLKKSEEKYRSLVENINEVIYAIDAEGNLDYLSPGIEKFAGFSSGEMVGRNFAEFIHPDDLAALMNDFGELTRGVVKPSEYRIMTKTGDYRWVMTTSRPSVEEGAFTGARGVLTDIHDKKLAQDALRESEERLRTIGDNLPGGMVYRLTVTADGVRKFTYISEGVRALHGYTQEQVMGNASLLYRQMIEEDYRRIREEEKRVMGDLSVFDSEARFRLPSGELRWYRLISQPRITESGEIIADGFEIDITDRKRAEEEIRQREQLLSSVFRAAPVGIGMVVDRVFTMANDRLCEIIGYAREELLGKSSRLIYPSDEDYSHVGNEKYRQISERGTGTVETRWMRRDGVIIDVLLSSTPIDTGDLSRGVTFTALDITAKKKNEIDLIKKTEEIEAANEELQAAIEELEATNEALFQSNRELENRTLELDDYFNYALDLFCIADDGGYFRRLNREWERVLGYTMDKLIGARFLDFVHPDDLDATLAALGDLGSQKEVLSFTNRFRRRDGGYRWIEWRSFTRGKLIYAAARDMTERIAAEEELKEKKQSMELILNSISEHFIFQTTDHRIIWTNKAAADSIGVGIEDLVGKRCHTLWGQSDTECSFCPFKEVRETGLPWEKETTTSDGRSWNIHGYPIKDENGDIVNFIEVTLEITARKKAQEELRKSEEKYRRIVDTAMEGVWQVDHEFRIVFANNRMADMLGYGISELPGRPTSDFLFEEDMAVQKTKWDNRKKGVTESYERRFRRRDGTTLWTITSASPLFDRDGNFDGTISMMTDITERKHAEEERERMQSQLVQAQKMEAIGTLAGGIAHDFNNVLGGIMGSLNLLELLLEKEEIAQREAINRYIETAELSCRRAADITQQLLALSRKGDLRLAPVDLSHSINQVKEIAKNSFPKSVILDFETGAGTFKLMADQTQIEQVLLNLCVNASHAMTLMREDGREGGTLSLRTTLVKGEKLKEAHPEANTDVSYAAVSIADSGIGMDEATKKRIFEPFFTTKDIKQGTGLGLTMAYGIVRQHQGFISIDSEPGKGTEVIVYLPVMQESTAAPVPGKRLKTIVRGTGRILIFDDEKAILRIAGGILEQCGYEVLTALNGSEGIEIYRNEYKTIDGVLLDLSMPGMSGLEVYVKLREINEGIKVVLSSGFLEEDTCRKARELGVRAFINKPYTAEELSVKMKELLSG